MVGFFTNIIITMITDEKLTISDVFFASAFAALFPINVIFTIIENIIKNNNLMGKILWKKRKK